MFTICLFMFGLHTGVLSITVRRYRHIFTATYSFHKINSSRHNNIMAIEIRYYNANS